MSADPGPYPIRPIAEDEFDHGHLVDQHAFHGSPLTAGDREQVLSRFEFDRSLAAIDPDSGTPAGITSIYSFQLTVPGATLPAAGVTFVGVLPSHRRRGVLRSLMHRQLADISSAGREPLAVLWASEAGIYGRYGYGRASWHLAFTVRRGEATMTPAASGLASGLRPRLVAPADVRPELAKVYDSVLPSRPGFFARSDSWWQRLLHDPPEERRGASPLRCALAEDESGPRGYALYSGLSRWEDETFLPDSALTVRELVAADPAASAALWSDLLSRDLTTEFRAALRPVDDPLLSHLADPRRARPQLSDGLWVRLIDVGAALAGRRYACPVDVVIEVRDPVLPGNAGRWRLRTYADGLAAAGGGLAGAGAGAGLAGAGLAAACERVSDPADVALDIAELGAVYLGGTRLGALAEADLVSELRPGAVRQLTAAMAWDPAPWCPMIF
ncbi:MAG: GNAT family N-acetyltransferase [Streptosporangiaceae bacterium]|nr:GNAT family N-acetyltransferase [Streptosporangiaceae bacterium]